MTYTAWFAITMNQLFNNIDYVCLLEYDVVLEDNFKEKITDICNKNTSDIVSFIKDYRHFLTDLDVTIFNKFLNMKNITYDMDLPWYHTTNHCLKREILDDFVNWYYPSAIDFWYLDRKMVSWYHERIFSVYLNVTKKKLHLTSGLRHIQNNSHHNFNTKTEYKLPLELIELYYKNTSDTETISKI